MRVVALLSKYTLSMVSPLLAIAHHPIYFKLTEKALEKGNSHSIMHRGEVNKD
jgi:hypothetical protein